MYNLFKKIIYTCTFMGIYAFSSHAYAAGNTFTIIDFKFSLTDPAFGDMGSAMGAQVVGVSPWGALVEGTYQGTSNTNVLTNFDFFGGPVYVYTAATNTASTNTGGGTVPGGPAPTIDLVGLTADMSSWFAEWSGTAFNQGNNAQWGSCLAHPIYGSAHPNSIYLSSIASVTDNLNGTYTVDWNSCIMSVPLSSFEGQIGFWQLTLRCDTCSTVNPGLADALTAAQAAQTTRTVTQGGGVVDITSSLNGATNHTFKWVTSDAGITDTDGTLNDGNFRFNPAAVTPGNYVFTSTYTDATNFPTSVDKGKGSIVIKVVASTAGLDINDANNNGIINQYDASLAANRIQAVLSNGVTYVLKSDKGSLKLGQAAFCAGAAARISQSELAAYGGSNCAAITNSSDDDSFTSVGVGGYHDFEIYGITPGEAVQLVIPLSATIPAHAVYRKYDKVAGVWGTFISAKGDSLKTAVATSDGVCPDPGSAAYTSGLTVGDNCLQLTITDGGNNDMDGAANGQILDPGAIATIKSGTKAELPSGCSISGNPQNLNEHGEWMLLAAFIAWLGFVSYRNRKQAE